VDGGSVAEVTFEGAGCSISQSSACDLVALKGVVQYPIRIKCAVLAWDVLQDALTGDGDATGTQPHAVG
jgi:NifU-like protein involved in Fe-S cluster formation